MKWPQLGGTIKAAPLVTHSPIFLHVHARRHLPAVAARGLKGGGEREAFHLISKMFKVLSLPAPGGCV